MMTAKPDPNERASSSETEAAPTGGNVKRKLLENLTVRLEAYLGGSAMTVAELTELEKGAVVPLDVPLTQAVELRLNGVAVAKGELVSVGDRFAVRLLEISK